MTRVINDYARKSKLLKDNEDNLTGEDVREGLTAVISVKHPNPQFEGQTKTKLGNSEVVKITNRLFSDAFSDFLMENPQIAKRIVEKGILAAKARVAAKRAREVTRKNLVWKFLTFQENWRTVLLTILQRQNSSSSKETQLVGQPNLVVTVNFRQFFQSAVRF